MRIICFSSLFPHAGEPTLGVFVERRLRHLLSDTDIDAKVIAPVPWFPFTQDIFGSYARAARAPQHEKRHGIDVCHPRFLMLPKLGMRFTPAAMAAAALPVFRRLIAEGFKPDIIDAHYLYPDGVAAAKIAATLDIPFVMTARGSDVTQIPAYGFARRAIVRACTAAATVNTVSQSLADELQHLGVPAEKLQTIRNGVDLDDFHPRHQQAGNDFLEARDVPRWQGPRVLVAGWLIERKRVDRVIEALADRGDVQLLVAGDGPLRRQLEQQARALGMADRCYFLGQIGPADMPGLMAAADLLVLASEREGWANVLLEAMASDTPVVATDVGGAREFVHAPAGYLCGEQDSLSDVISRALEAHKSEAAGAVRSYAEKFSWRQVSSMQQKTFINAVKDSLVTGGN